MVCRWTKMEKCDYINGKINGHYTRRYINGQKEKEGNLDDKQTGYYIAWYKNGQKKNRM